MDNEPLNRVLRHVRQLGGGNLTDSELLDRFLGRLDDSAFEALMRRHGPMVQRTCRRVLGDVHAAEDAFQATFLVLARKGSAIRQRRSIAGWLYEVAYNLALRARADAARRRLHERRAGEMPTTPTAPIPDAELQAALDEELHRLPEKHRTPLVLCYIEGKTNEEAARELGWPTGSISYRLAQARERLRKRLSNRGLALPASALLVLLSESTAPAVSAPLLKTTVQAATSFAAGKAIAAGTASAEAVALAEGALHTMLTTKVKIAAGLLLAVGLLGTGARMFVQADPAAPPTALAAADPKARADEPSRRVDADGDLLPPGAVARLGSPRWWHNSRILFIAYSADGKQIITAARDGDLRVLEASSGKELRKFGKKPVPVPVPADPGPPPEPVAPGGRLTAELSGVALSFDARTLAAVNGHDGSVTLWEVATGNEIRTFKSNSPTGITTLAFAPDGKRLFARGSDASVRQFDLAEGKELSKLPPPPFDAPVSAWAALGVTADSKTVLTVGRNQGTGLVRSWEVSTGKEQVLRGPKLTDFMTNVVLSPDGKLVAFGLTNGTIHVWDIAAGKEVQKFVGPQQNFPAAMAFAPDGKTLAIRTAADAVLHLWSVTEGKEIHKLGEAPAQINYLMFLYDPYTVGNLAFSSDGGQIATSLDDLKIPGTEANAAHIAAGTGDHTVHQFDAKTGKKIAAPSGVHQGAVLSLALSSDGKSAVTRSRDGTVHLWSVDTGKETKRYALPARIGHAAFSADGKLLVLGVLDGNVLLWDAVEGKELTSWKAAAQPNQGLAALAISPDGKTVATRGSDQSIHLWDVTGRELRQVADASEGIMPGMIATQNLAFSPDGTLLAGMAADKAATPKPSPNPAVAIAALGPLTLRFWDVATGQQLRKFEPLPNNVNTTAFAFAPDGRSIATINSDSSISLLESASGKERQRITFKPLEAGNSGLSCIAFAPNSKLLAAAGAEGVIRLWDMVAGKEGTVLKGHQSDIVTLAFAAKGRRLASGSSDSSALIWAVPAETEITLAPQIEAKQAEALYEDLAGSDAAKAYQAMRILSQVPAQAVPLLKQRVSAVPPPDARKLAQLIADLDGNAFAARMKAEAELEKIGELAADALRKALANQPSLEMQKRLEGLLAKLVTTAPNPQQLRTLRALEVLENAGTPEARDVLKTVAGGAAGVRVTKEAQAALGRLSRR